MGMNKETAPQLLYVIALTICGATNAHADQDASSASRAISAEDFAPIASESILVTEGRLFDRWTYDIKIDNLENDNSVYCELFDEEEEFVIARLANPGRDRAVALHYSGPQAAKSVICVQYSPER